MPAPRSRRIVRHAVIVLAIAVLLCTGWLMVREPPEIERSRALRLGMTRAQVEAVMGDANGAQSVRAGNSPILIAYYGRSQRRFKNFFSWLGLPTSGAYWPVRVHYRKSPPGWCVARIERGDEVEE